MLTKGKKETIKKDIGKKTVTPKKGKKSNIIIGSLVGKIKVAPDIWDEDLKQTIDK